MAAVVVIDQKHWFGKDNKIVGENEPDNSVNGFSPWVDSSKELKKFTKVCISPSSSEADAGCIQNDIMDAVTDDEYDSWKFDEKNLTLTLRWHAVDWVRDDKGRLVREQSPEAQQVLENVIHNALNYAGSIRHNSYENDACCYPNDECECWDKDSGMFHAAAVGMAMPSHPYFNRIM